MAFTGGAICTSFKKECYTGTHIIKATGGDVFKIALYNNTATLSAATTVYTTAGEITGTNYTAGGIALTNKEPGEFGTTAFAQWESTSFANLTASGIRGALIYNSTKSNRAVAVIDFGADKSVTASAFPVTMPTYDATNALLRTL